VAQTLRAHSYQFEYQVPGGRWRWTTSFDVSGPVPSVQILDITSPFGRLRDSIPFPGEVVEAMGASIETVRQMFPPGILLGPPTTLSFTVDEGRGFSDPIQVIVTNDGAFGSLLAASLTTSAGYLSVTPANLGSLASNATGIFEASVDSSLLLAGDSPIAATITVQDPNATDSPQVLPVTITVRPKAVVGAAPLALNCVVTKPLEGDWPVVPVQLFQVQNNGPAGSVLDWQVTRVGNLSSWLIGVGPSSGTLASGETANVQVQVAPDSRTMAGTTYQETLRVSGYSSNQYVDVLVTLQVL
jgi:hypothetical protein